MGFEGICSTIFGRCGFKTKKIGGTSDGGHDILVWGDSGKMVVECKHQEKKAGRP